MTAKRRTTEVRQRQIIDAAREVIARQGAEHVTVRRLSSTVGISEAAVYRHFKSKRDILSFLVQDVERQWMNEIEQSQTGRRSALDTLDDVLRSRISTAEQRGGISFQVMAEIISLGDKRLNRQAAAVVDRYIDELAAIIARGVADGELCSGIDPQVVATLLFGMVQGLVNIWALNSRGFDLIKRYTALWETFYRLIAGRLPALERQP